MTLLNYLLNKHTWRAYHHGGGGGGGGCIFETLGVSFTWTRIQIFTIINQLVFWFMAYRHQHFQKDSVTVAFGD